MLKYVCIGPQKCGTTWLYHNLRLMGGFSFPIKEKEIFFWDRYYRRGLNWYFGNFSCQENMAEISPSYFVSGIACERLYAHNPDLKILICLRDPVDRCISHFKHHYKKGRVSSDLFRAVEQLPEIKEAGHYDKYCRMWLHKFRPENIKIVCYDEIRKRPEVLLSEIITFFSKDIKVDLSVIDPTPQNIASVPKSYLLAKIFTMIADMFRNLNLYKIIQLGKRLGLKSVYQGGVQEVNFSDHHIRKIEKWFARDQLFLQRIKRKRHI